MRRNLRCKFFLRPRNHHYRKNYLNCMVLRNVYTTYKYIQNSMIHFCRDDHYQFKIGIKNFSWDTLCFAVYLRICKIIVWKQHEVCMSLLKDIAICFTDNTLLYNETLTKTILGMFTSIQKIPSPSCLKSIFYLKKGDLLQTPNCNICLDKQKYNTYILHIITELFVTNGYIITWIIHHIFMLYNNLKHAAG